MIKIFIFLIFTMSFFSCENSFTTNQTDELSSFYDVYTLSLDIKTYSQDISFKPNKFKVESVVFSINNIERLLPFSCNDDFEQMKFIDVYNYDTFLLHCNLGYSSYHVEILLNDYLIAGPVNIDSLKLYWIIDTEIKDEFSEVKDTIEPYLSEYYNYPSLFKTTRYIISLYPGFIDYYNLYYFQEYINKLDTNLFHFISNYKDFESYYLNEIYLQSPYYFIDISNNLNSLNTEILDFLEYLENYKESNHIKINNYQKLTYSCNNIYEEIYKYNTGSNELYIIYNSLNNYINDLSLLINDIHLLFNEQKKINRYVLK